MASLPSLTQQVAAEGTEIGDDRTEDGRLKFLTKHYEQLGTQRGAIRILNVFPGHAEDSEINCEFLHGTILEYEERVKLTPVPEFQPYDALSWNWGSAAEDSWINIKKNGTRYAKAVKSDLLAALRALRHHEHDRPLWIDAICIDQSNAEERNHQVEMMADIYGKADCVRIWLGPPTESSRIAIRFVKDEVLQLQHFDELCESKEFSAKWNALLELMQRPWFSRRWVVQEVALAQRAIIHCGKAKISWNKFAVAVELFVEVETATHRLSEVMKKDPKYHHVGMWFEYVSALGASLLVDATGKLFRDYEYSQGLQGRENNPRPRNIVRTSFDVDEGVNFESEDDELLSPADRASQHERDEIAKKLTRKIQPLLTLEYLVCLLSVFDTAKQHDTIYALLGIAKDTTPTAANKKLRVSDHTQAALEMFTEKQQYTVDYEAQYVDICKEFVQFCVGRSLKLDPSRALDVICRPWASEEFFSVHSDEEMPLPSWVPQLSKAAYGMDTKPGIDKMQMARKNADALVGLPSLTQRNYNAAETKKLDRRYFRFRKRVTAIAKEVDESRTSGVQPEADIQNPELEKEKDESFVHQENSKTKLGNANEQESPRPEEETSTNTSGGVMDESKPKLNHFSMYVRGFVLDKIMEVQPSSQNGSIPSEWADFAGWKRMEGNPSSLDGNPPDHFWRTLVADRGRDGKNPPVYYSRACKESFHKGSFQSGTVDTTGLINNERNSVVAQFCRRVQAAIWNRALVRTEGKKLGLVAKNVQVGDLVCILYGCSVPVILRMQGPKDPAVMDAEMEWELEYLATVIQRKFKDRIKRRELFRVKRENDNQLYKAWEAMKREEWLKDEGWVKRWERRRSALISIHEFKSWVTSEDNKQKRSKEDMEKMQQFINVALSDLCIPKKDQIPPQFWKEFQLDDQWRKQWRQDNYRLTAENGFNAKLKEKGRRAGLIDDWKATRQEWDKDDQWRSRWKAENSNFLCIDSFRAWLRESGKFWGTRKEVDDKQDWEVDIEWRKAWRQENRNASEEQEFVAWMKKSGKEHSGPQVTQELKIKEERREYTEWSNQWRKDHPDATIDSEFDEWKRVRTRRAERARESDKLRSEEAMKKEKEPFIERWRSDWSPPEHAKNWDEFYLALHYGRKWITQAIRKKKTFIKEQGQLWSERDTQTARQSGRRELWAKRKQYQEEAIGEHEARIKKSQPSSSNPSKVKALANQRDIVRKKHVRHDSSQSSTRKTITESNPVTAPKPSIDNGHRDEEVQEKPEPSKPDSSIQIDTDQNLSGSKSDLTHNVVVAQVSQEKSLVNDPYKAHNGDAEARDDSLSQCQVEEAADSDSEQSSEPARRSLKTTRSRTTLLAQEIASELQTELSRDINSTADLKAQIKRKMKELPTLWSQCQMKLDLMLEEYKHETPRLTGRDGKQRYDCGDKGKRKRRQRLTEEEKRICDDRIRQKFKARLGEDGLWWYQMLGESYIHGMMDGEAMAHQNNEGIPTTVFEVR